MYSSYFDSEKSEEEASKLPYNEDLGSAEGLDPLELERTELPRSSKVGGWAVPFACAWTAFCTRMVKGEVFLDSMASQVLDRNVGFSLAMFARFMV